jgi:nitronate monooxygenase
MTAEFLPSQLPIIQAPMAGSQGVELCAAVCEAGGLGSLPTAMLAPPELRDQIAELRRRTRAPFNVNFFCHVPPKPDPERHTRWLADLAPDYAEAALDPPAGASGPGRAPFDSAMAEIIEEAKPPVVSFHFGLPEESLLERVKQTGAKIYSSATTAAEARWLEGRGVDAIIAQGAEAGGHRGMFLTEDIYGQSGLFALLPQIVDAVRVPVIAAGGIADGRGIAAAFVMGASAAQIGTAYLLAPQSTISPIHREALRAAKDDSTRLTNLFTGRPARGILNRFMREHGPMSELAPQFPLATGAVAPLRAHHEKRGSGDYSPLWAGQAAALAREEDAGHMTVRLWGEAKAALARARLTS